jgi:hypothetical protein
MDIGCRLVVRNMKSGRHCFRGYDVGNASKMEIKGAEVVNGQPGDLRTREGGT